MPRPVLPKVTVEDFEEAVGAPLDTFAHQCHAASIALVKSGLLGRSRVARGSCPGVGGQHSWVVVGDDCYSPKAVVVDPTLWSYDKDVEGIWVGKTSKRPHTPHGAGSIWQWGKPTSFGGEPVEIERASLGVAGEAFLRMIGPLDLKGWMHFLSHAPVGGWPAAEIFAAADDTPELAALVPIDRLGMLTDRNPEGLYLPTEGAVVR